MAHGECPPRVGQRRGGGYDPLPQAGGSYACSAWTPCPHPPPAGVGMCCGIQRHAYPRPRSRESMAPTTPKALNTYGPAGMGAERSVSGGGRHLEDAGWM